MADNSSLGNRIIDYLTLAGELFCCDKANKANKWARLVIGMVPAFFMGYYIVAQRYLVFQCMLFEFAVSE